MSPEVIEQLNSLVVPVVFLVVAWAVAYALIRNRTTREGFRAELHAKLLERVSSAHEFGEFLGSPAGERFLQSLSPARPTNRLWVSIRVGTFAIAFAIFVIGADFVNLLNADLRAFVTFAWLLLAFGVAVLISATVSYKAARHLGIDVPPEERISPAR
jgi:hypothetical protein